jgi:hypothetical protein
VNWCYTTSQTDTTLSSKTNFCPCRLRMSLGLTSDSDEDLADDDNSEVNLDDLADDDPAPHVVNPQKVCARQNTCIA